MVSVGECLQIELGSASSLYKNRGYALSFAEPSVISTILVSLLFINLGLGVITRAAPALNIFAVGFPAMILAGIILLAMSMNSIGFRIQWLWRQGFETLSQALGLS